MGFSEEVQPLLEVLSSIGLEVNISDYDGVFVKKLAATNTLTEENTGNATHIAITGDQMNFFPYVELPGYFDAPIEEKDDDLKQFFMGQIAGTLTGKNVEYLGGQCDYNTKDIYVTVWGSRRKDGSKQLQMSATRKDSPEFIEFRKLIHANSYLVILKRKQLLKYDFYAIKEETAHKYPNFASGFEAYYGKDKSSTMVQMDKYLGEQNNTVDEDTSFLLNTPEQRKEAYRKWLSMQLKEDGQPYTEKTVDSYVNRPEYLYNLYSLDKYESFYDMDKLSIVEEYKHKYFNDEGFQEADYNTGRRSASNGIKKYGEFLKCVESTVKQYNRILYGAPGTGKSYMLKEDAKVFVAANMERVTFHPAYSYAQFFGSFKPISEQIGEKTDIAYKFVPGPFLRVLLKALANPSQNYLLVIEEINRANVAAVFGDVFQLLDRKNGESEYPIAISDELFNYITNDFNQQVQVEGYERAISIPKNDKKIKIPANMYIWATMNSADQGVQPMDTAFKRRWDFEYIGIDEGQDNIKEKLVQLKLDDGTVQKFYWNKLRKKINELLSEKGAGVPEDKQLGPFFIPLSKLEGDKFQKAFENKVLMYLFEDAAQYCHNLIFGDEYTSFAKLLKDFKVKGATLIGNFSEFESDDSTADKDD